MRKKREEEIEALQSKLSELNASIDHGEVEIKKSQAGIQQVSGLLINVKCLHSSSLQLKHFTQSQPYQRKFRQNYFASNAV